MSTQPAALGVPATLSVRRPALPRWLGPAALVFGGWTALWAFSLSQQVLLRATTGQGGPTFQSTFWGLESVWLWAAFTPFIFAVARRFPLERGTWARHLAAHLVAAAFFCVVDVAFDSVVTALTGVEHRGSFGERLFGRAFINVFSYAALVGIAHAVAYHREASERRARAAALERELLQARLQAIEAQIHPHFLFNTLHTAASLVRAGEDRGAIQVLVGLSDLLRAALRNRDAQEVPLDEELEFVRRYLEVEGVRFQDRLRAEVRVEPGVPAGARVPHMILQPLVENAIRHGVESRAAAGRVRVLASARDGMLWLRVEDDGAGPGGSGRNGRGIGLGTTRERLKHLYGERHHFSLEPGEAGGAVATVALPLATGEAGRG
jgi:hypothetical protein